MSSDGLTVPIANYERHLISAYKQAQDSFNVLYYGDQRRDQAAKLETAIKGIIEERSRYDPDIDAQKEVTVLTSDINRENTPDKPYSFQSDAGNVPLKDDSVDLAVTHHLLCGIEESSFDDVVSELERVSKSEPINTA